MVTASGDSVINAFGGMLDQGTDHSLVALEDNSVMNVYGGFHAEVLMVSDTELNVFGGEVWFGVYFNGDGDINLFDGDIGAIAFSFGTGGSVNICGGSLGNLQDFGFYPDVMQVNLLQGSIDQVRLFGYMADMNVFGGKITDPSPFMNAQRLEFYGSEFRLHDSNTGTLIEDLTPQLQFGIPLELTHASGQELRGVYADGSEFELNLNFVDALEGCWLSLSTTVEPDSLNVVRGVQNSGTLADVLVSDDSRAEFQPGFVLNSTEPPVWLEFVADVQGSVPSNLRVMVESQATTPGIEIEIEAWNFTTMAFESIISKNESFNQDELIISDLSDGIANYVEPTTLDTRFRVGWRQTGFVLNFPWRINIDQVAISVN